MQKYGTREICDVVFRAKGKVDLGSFTFEKDEPVFLFDTLKTSSLEGASSTVYATGGKGNARLIGWDGDRTLTFNMEDALISPVSLAMLSGAGLLDNGADSTDADFYQHITERIDVDTANTATLTRKPEISEDFKVYYGVVDTDGNIPVKLSTATAKTGDETGMSITITAAANTVVYVDYYTKRAKESSNMFEIDITPEIKSYNFYIEGSTLWRDTLGQDHPAEIIIPNGKVQSNFTVSMAPTGDPGTFSFVVDAFPGYLKGNKKKKLLSAIQILDTLDDTGE